MSWSTMLPLGALAGGTIYIGLLAGRFPVRRPALRSALSIFAAGIITFLLIEIFSGAGGQTAAAWRSGSAAVAGWLTVLLIGGFALGLVGLAAFTGRLVKRAQEAAPRQISVAIATGIGFHNLSEGLAIGASAAVGQTALAIGLVIGFAAHNATEGFGILAPTTRQGELVSWERIGILGLIGGGPTFAGVLLGGAWTNRALSILALALAAGALLFVLRELLSGIPRQAGQVALNSMLVAGLALGWGTELLTSTSQGHATGSAAASITEADGDQITAPRTTGGRTALSASELHREAAASSGLLHEHALVPAMAGGVAHFTLTAAPFSWEPYPGRVITVWGYNHQVDGPLFRWRVGDRVAITVRNDLPQATSVHWHGLAVPNTMDGDGMSRPPIKSGGSFTYRFTVTQQMLGTHYYHSHVNGDFQVDMGLRGPIIVDPASGRATPPHTVDALYQLSSFKIGGSDSENVFTMDGRSYPYSPELHVRRGEYVRLRLINSSAEEFHTMHLHGYTFTVLARDGNPLGVRERLNTITLGPGETADIGFVAQNPGTWMFHCHVMDHTINPGPAGDGSVTQIAPMGGLTTFIHVR